MVTAPWEGPVLCGDVGTPSASAQVRFLTLGSEIFNKMIDVCETHTMCNRNMCKQSSVWTHPTHKVQQVVFPSGGWKVREMGADRTIP